LVSPCKFGVPRSDTSFPSTLLSYLLYVPACFLVSKLVFWFFTFFRLLHFSSFQVSKRFLYPGGTKALLEGAARAKDRGLCSAVGVVGFSASEVESAHAYLASRGVTLVSNTVEVSLLNQEALQDGTVATCKKLGVQVLAAAPLAHGLCSGRYTATNPTGGKFLKNPRQTQKFTAAELRKARFFTTCTSTTHHVLIQVSIEVTWVACLSDVTNDTPCNLCTSRLLFFALRSSTGVPFDVCARIRGSLGEQPWRNHRGPRFGGRKESESHAGSSGTQLGRRQRSRSSGGCQHRRRRPRSRGRHRLEAEGQ